MKLLKITLKVDLQNPFPDLIWWYQASHDDKTLNKKSATPTAVLSLSGAPSGHFEK